MSLGFDVFGWYDEGNLPWVVSSESCSSGAAIESGNITDGQSSVLMSEYFNNSNGTISFAYKVSSESGYDLLRITVVDSNNVAASTIATASGTSVTDYTDVSFDPSGLAAGYYRFKFSYTKDSSVSSGTDTAYICNISGLPAKIIWPTCGIQSTYPRLAPGANYGASGVRAVQITVARQDREDGGAYRLTGVVTSNGSPARRRVRLFDQLNGRLIRETWSDAATGVYIFENIRAGTFFVLVHDYTGQFDPDAKADLQSEPMA